MKRATKHVLIVGHPHAQSFTLSAARVYAEAVENLGHSVVLRDLYRLGFEPRLQDEEIPRPSGFMAAPDVGAERALIADGDVFAFFYPLWFNVPPAVIVGYVQRIFGMGFGYGPQTKGQNARLLLGRSMLSFSSSGAPSEWLRSEGGWDALKNLFDEHLASVCGMSVLGHRHYGRVLNSTPSARIEAHLKDVRETAVRHFTDA